MNVRALTVAIAGVTSVAFAAPALAASWNSTGTGLAASKADALPTTSAAAPTVSVSGSTVNINFAAVSTSGGVAASTYLVQGYSAAASGTVTSSFTCTRSSTTPNCTDAPGVGTTTYYTYTPKLGTKWSGVESARSLAATVANGVAGIKWSGLVPDGGKTLNCNYSNLAAVTCTISGVGNKGGFTAAKVQLMDASQNAITNSGSAITISVAKDSGSFNPASPSLSIANGASATGNSFDFTTANGNVTGKVTATATIAGATYKVDVTVTP